VKGGKREKRERKEILPHFIANQKSKFYVFQIPTLALLTHARRILPIDAHLPYGFLAQSHVISFIPSSRTIQEISLVRQDPS
jgi:hypothetical protein